MTAPCLHNGSVGFALRAIAAARRAEAILYVGTREFDLQDVGLVTTKENRETGETLGNTFEFGVRDENGVPIDGKSNEGHDYDNASLFPGERRALAEYLRTL